MQRIGRLVAVWLLPLWAAACSTLDMEPREPDWRREGAGWASSAVRGIEVSTELVDTTPVAMVVFVENLRSEPVTVGLFTVDRALVTSRTLQPAPTPESGASNLKSTLFTWREFGSQPNPGDEITYVVQFAGSSGTEELDLRFVVVRRDQTYEMVVQPLLRLPVYIVLLPVALVCAVVSPLTGDW